MLSLVSRTICLLIGFTISKEGCSLLMRLSIQEELYEERDLRRVCQAWKPVHIMTSAGEERYLNPPLEDVDLISESCGAEESSVSEEIVSPSVPKLVDEGGDSTPRRYALGRLCPSKI